MKTAYTPGPLTVAIDEIRPFDIRTRNADGETVFLRGMPSYSTKQRSAAECMAGVNISPSFKQNAISDNARALADETLRAAAPLLAEALVSILADDGKTGPTWAARRAAARDALRAAGVELGE